MLANPVSRRHQKVVIKGPIKSIALLGGFTQTVFFVRPLKHMLLWGHKRPRPEFLSRPGAVLPGFENKI